jgi:hypothetical protein
VGSLKCRANPPGNPGVDADFIKSLKTNRPEYRSYLLRMWRESADGEWRSSLQDTVSCKTYFFADLPALAAFLGAQGGDEAPGQAPNPKLRERLRVVVPQPAQLIEEEHQHAE